MYTLKASATHEYKGRMAQVVDMLMESETSHVVVDREEDDPRAVLFKVCVGDPEESADGFSLSFDADGMLVSWEAWEG